MNGLQFSAARRPTRGIRCLGGHVDVTDSAPHIAVSPIAASRAAASRLRAALAHPPRPALQGLLALATYLAVSIACFAPPLINNLNVPVVGRNQVAPNFCVWGGSWWPYAVSPWITRTFR